MLASALIHDEYKIKTREKKPEGQYIQAPKFMKPTGFKVAYFIGTILSAVMQPLLDWCVNISRKAQNKKLQTK